MSNDSANYSVDSREVINLFKDLDYKNQKKSYKQALRKSANILAREARKQLKQKMGNSANRKTTKYGPLIKGIKAKVARSAKSAKVHIMGDFRLKFFELGTAPRYLRRKHNFAYRGKITANHFFKSARQNKEQAAKDSLISNLEESIRKINAKHR